VKLFAVTLNNAPDNVNVHYKDPQHFTEAKRSAGVHAIDADRLIFEAPQREQQVWLLHRFGTECNLGNIVPADVLSLETLRLGLRSDTVERFAPGGED